VKISFLDRVHLATPGEEYFVDLVFSLLRTQAMHFLVAHGNQSRLDAALQAIFRLDSFMLHLSRFEVAECLSELGRECANTAVPLLLFIFPALAVLVIGRSTVETNGLIRSTDVREANSIGMEERPVDPTTILDHLLGWLVVELGHNWSAQGS